MEKEEKGIQFGTIDNKGILIMSILFALYSISHIFLFPTYQYSDPQGGGQWKNIHPGVI